MSRSILSVSGRVSFSIVAGASRAAAFGLLLAIVQSGRDGTVINVAVLMR